MVTPRPPFRDRGDFEVANGHITRRGDSLVYCGIALLDPAALRGRTAEPFSLRDVYFEAMEQRALTAQIWGGYWTDIGTAEQLAEVNARHRP